MSEVLGCGIDIEELSRFKSKIPSGSETGGFVEMVYTPGEIARNLQNHPDLTFPLCFSCKEAFFKAFGVSWMNSGISWKDIELLFLNSQDLKDYKIKLKGYAKKLFLKKKCRKIDSYFEYTDVYVVFEVILLS